MATRLQSIWRTLTMRDGPRPNAVADVTQSRRGQVSVETVEFAPSDPIVAYLQGASGLVEVDKLNLDSPAVQRLRDAGVKIAVPLISQGELVGLLNLGPHLGEQEYSTDDRRLIHDLASQAAPAVRVAQLVRHQEAEARDRQRLEQEMEVARVIQRTLLPSDVPHLPGWHVNAYYRPAQEVGGDCYDFLDLPGGKLGLVIGDVTDKGVPTALVMATARAILRAAAERLGSPAEVLQRVNDLLHPDIPSKMFVTCLYAVLDPGNGRLLFANAGHCLPYRRNDGGVEELRATGMPLGLMPGMTYEEKEVSVLPGESVLFYSDGLVEAHNAEREMFGFPRLQDLVANHPGGSSLIDFLLAELEGFTGAGREQEDDVTLVTLERSLTTASVSSLSPGGTSDAEEQAPVAPAPAGKDAPRTLVEFEVPSEPGNERVAIERVAEAVRELGVEQARLERLQTAVGEATMNAMEHGNEYRSDLPVSIRVAVSETALSVGVTDHGGGEDIPEAETPDLEAKLSGAQTPRGWGLFLIKNLVDEMIVTRDQTHHTVELVLRLEGDEDGS